MAATDALERTDGRCRAQSAGAALRIALMVEEFPVLSETFVINQAAGLVARGHDLTILAMVGRGGAGGTMHDTVHRHRLADRVAEPVARRLLVDPFRRGPKAGDGPLPAWSRAQRGSAFLAQALMMAPMRRFDVVHCQFATLGLVAARHIAAGTLRTRRLVVHLRGYDVSRFVQERGPDVYRPLFARADLLIANCEHFRRRAITLGAAPERVAVVGSPIEIERFPLKPDRPLGPGPARIVSIGRLTEKKGFAYAIRAVAALAAEERDLRYEIIGEGPLRPSLENLVGELGLGDRIRLPGAMDHGAIAERLGEADLLVAPSVRAASGDEDAPVNALKEGMAVGLPVVATLHGGIPELVEEGVSGHLVPERDAEALAAALRRLLDAPERWRAMGVAGRRKVVGEYGQTTIVNKTVEIYRTLLREMEPT